MRLDMKWLALLLTFMLVGSFALADDIPAKHAIKCIMGEARGESFEGQVAVAEVIRRRGKLVGIYGCSYATYTEAEWKEAERAWKKSRYTNYSKGATHFESIDFKKPYWSKNMKLVTTIGKHQFYLEKK